MGVVERTEPAPAGRCPWCGSGLDLARAAGGLCPCANCGAAVTYPWPSEEELEAAYGSWYRPGSGRFTGLGDRALAASRARLARRLDRLAPPGSVLDVGAGVGTLVGALRARGREALGLERSSGLQPGMREAEVTDIDGRWAAVVFWHSLEHLRWPGAAVEHAAGLLVPGGILTIAVPNLGSLQARVFGPRWFALDLPRHLVHLPADTLTQRLRQLGLEVQRESHWRGGQLVFGWLYGLVASLPGHLDLYDAIRRPSARRSPMSQLGRATAVALGAVLLPVAMAAAALEVLLRRGGTVYVEARLI